MTVTLTYDAALSRVRITADALAAADYATVERSTDQIMWTTVRGGMTAPVTAGSLAQPVDDYEFVAGKQNFYRVRGIETGAITFVAAGVAATANNASVVPAHPAGLVVGDLKVTFASIRNSGTGMVNTPAGWTVMHQFGQTGGVQRNGVLLGRIHQSGDVAPTVTFANGVLNADTIAQMAAWRRAALTPAASVDMLNGSTQNIAYPALTIPKDDLLVIVAGWKQDDWTSVATLAGFTEIGEPVATAGDDAGQVWDYQIQTTKADIVAGSFVVTGGAAGISRAITMAVEHAPFLNEQTASLTPVLDRIFLESVTRPFLNRAVTVVGWSDVSRASRGADFDVVGRTLAVAVTDLAGGKQFDLEVYAATADDAKTIDFIIASGDILFLQTPLGCEVPRGHYRVDTSSERRPHRRASSRVFTLPLRQVAAPGPDVVGAVSMWQTVLNSYPSWAALLAANSSWEQLLSRVAPPSEVIVP